MNLHAITMVRNEADIWADFISFNSEIFDRLVIIDHCSTDGTAEITDSFEKNGFPIELLRYEERGYYQAHLSNTIARRSFEAGADWVFFIDADEFINVPDRDGLLRILEAHDEDVLKFNWINLVPTKFGTFEDFDLSQTFLSDGRTSQYGKVAIRASWAARHPNFEVQMGNHHVRPSPEARLIDAPVAGQLNHLPIRSVERLRNKIANGIAAYKTRSGAGPSDGFHWFELYNSIESGRADLNAISKIIMHYGEPVDSTNHEILPRNNVTLPRIRARNRDILYKSLKLKVVEERDFAVPWRHTTRYPGTDIAAVVVAKNIRLQPRLNRGDGTAQRRIFSKLPVGDKVLSETSTDGLFNSLASALESAFQVARTRVPSAWSGHIPLMFCLMSLLRPRRYLELGSHFGMSFFAACQAAQEIDPFTECVAIDTWSGDAHAGIYSEDVFNQFTEIVRKEYSNVGYYIRSSFLEALPCFESGSIDILHIDGLHTYEAVKQDYELWLPKMSDRGVIMFHDTTVYEGDFGVWRLWKELERRHPTFNLLHSHGLGIAFVGVQPSLIADLLRSLNSDARLSVLVNTLFRSIGKLVTS